MSSDVRVSGDDRVESQLALHGDEGRLFTAGRADSGEAGKGARQGAAAAVGSWNLRSPAAVLARDLAVDLVTRGRASL
jgi:hypothetical protein